MDIKDLVERRAAEIHKWSEGGTNWADMHKGEKKRWLEYARIALSDPELYVKVERELPMNPHTLTCFPESARPTLIKVYEEAQQDMLKAGYLPVTPLPEAIKNMEDEDDKSLCISSKR